MRVKVTQIALTLLMTCVSDIINLNNADYEPEDINTEIFSVDSDPSQKRDWTIYLNANGTDVGFKIDSGA